MCPRPCRRPVCSSGAGRGLLWSGSRRAVDLRAFRHCGPHSWNVITVAILVPFFAALLIADRVALIYATNRVARQIEDRGFPAKPQVSIAGFPFLTQVAARRLNKVMVSAAGKKLGPVEVKRLDVTLYGIRVSSGYRVRAASELSGTALIGF